MSRSVIRKPELSIDSKGKEASTRMGQYSDQVTMQLAQKHQGKIVTVRDIVRVQYGRMNNRNEEYVRNRLTKAVNSLLRAGIPAFPVYEAIGHHRKIGIKVVTEYNKEDFEQLTNYKDAAVNRGDLSRDKADLIANAMATLKVTSEGGEQIDLTGSAG